MKWGMGGCYPLVRSFAREVLNRAPLARRVYYQIRDIPERVPVLLYKRMAIIAIALLRYAARRKRTDSGVTVVIVTWNSLKFLRTTLAAVGEYGGSNVKVMVIDNHSTDGVHRFLREQHPNVRLVRLPRNIDHGLAMDIGFLLARTEFVVSLDVDAFPISPNWLPTLLDPLNHGYRVSGMHQHRAYAHPCCLAMRFRNFVDSRHTFSRNWDGTDLGIDLGIKHWDTGELISMREKGRVFLIEKGAVRGPGRALGSVFGDILYHNFYSTAHRGDPRVLIDVRRPGGVVIGKLSQADVLAAWEEAKEKYLRRSDTLA